MKDLPVIEPKEVITTITNMKTGEPITNDEQMFIDNEIANLRFP